MKTKEAGFLAEEVLPCSFDTNLRVKHCHLGQKQKSKSHSQITKYPKIAPKLLPLSLSTAKALEKSPSLLQMIRNLMSFSDLVIPVM